MKNITVQRVVGMCLICGLVAVVLPESSEAAEKIVLVGSQDIKDSFQGRWLALIYTEAFRRLGYELQYDGYPMARAIAMSDAGEVDGEISRGFEYQTAHPNLIRVDEPHFSVRFAAYAIKPGIVLEGWNSLKDTAYTVEYRRGLTFIETRLKSVVAPEKLSDIATVEQGLKKLITGRTDLYVDLESNVIDAMKRLNAAEFDPSAVYQAGIIQDAPAHAYLHNKHSALIPKVAEVLKAMKQEGLIEHYKNVALENTP